MTTGIITSRTEINIQRNRKMVNGVMGCQRRDYLFPWQLTTSSHDQPNGHAFVPHGGISGPLATMDEVLVDKAPRRIKVASEIRIRCFTVESLLKVNRTVKVAESVPCSESGTKMPFLSAADDFLNTLKAIPCFWTRLRYLGGLRRRNGNPSHWGLERVHGQNAAEQAIRDAQQAVFAQVLRRPLKELLEDGRLSAAEDGLACIQFFERLSEQKKTLLPETLGGGPARHFNSVLMAMSALSQAHSVASRPAA
jgi:hypothetical protein